MRIALIKPSALGDIVHALPVAEALRQRFPDADIAWVVNRAYEPLLIGHPALTRTIAFERGALKGGWREAAGYLFDFGRRLRRERFDLVIDLQGLLRTGLMTAATAAPVRLGLEGAREGAGHFTTHTLPIPQRQQMHAVERYWRVAEAFGVGHLPKRFRLTIQPEAAAWADAVLRPLPRPWLAISVGSRWLTKRWPTAHFGELARRAWMRYGGSTIFIGTADEAAMAVNAADGLSGQTLHLSGKTSLAQLAALLARADTVLANDTGPLHLAAALGVPVVAPYTCTRIERHGPFGQFDGARATTVACAGSYLRRCESLVCMTDLTPDRLWPILDEALHRWTVRRTA